jgi:hypothetical protein
MLQGEAIRLALRQEGNCCIRGPRIWGLGTTRGQVGTIEIPAGEVLRECLFPDLFQRPEISISTPPERELPLANPMGELDSC